MLLSSDIHRAAREHTTLDWRQVHAVFTRAELNLRIGAAFTRLQSLKLSSFFQDRKIVSYGKMASFLVSISLANKTTCRQLPVPDIGICCRSAHCHPKLCARRVLENSHVIHTRRGRVVTTQFNWKRSHLFDRWACFVLYEQCIQNPTATVTKVITKQVRKW